MGYKGILASISPNSLLISEPFPFSLWVFLTRIGYALSYWKLFWFGEFSATGLNYGTPVFVPFMLPFLAPFFYASVLCIPIFYRKHNNIMKAYFMLIVLMLFGILQPVFNITNPQSGFEPSEGIFSLPFYCIISAFSFYLFLSWISKSFKLYRARDEIITGKTSILLYNRKGRMIIASFLITAILLFAGINISTFSTDLYVSSNAYYQDNNNSLNYIFYGWNHVSQYLVENHLYNECLYYTPGKGGLYYNLSSSNNFNYFFFHQNFPLYWLYTYSGGKITVVHPLYPGTIPSIPEHSAIILSQNLSYPRLLNANGIDNSILYTVYRTDGQPAIEVIQISNDINLSEQTKIDVNNLFYRTNISQFDSFNISSLSNLSNQITISIKFSIPFGLLHTGKLYSLIVSQVPTFSLGIWPYDIFIHGTNNSLFVPVGDIYTNYGCYTAEYSWQRLFGNLPISYNTTYMLTMTFYNGLMHLYLNSTLLSSYKLKYPLYPLVPPIVYIDYNLNASIEKVGIWSIALNAGEIGFIYYKGFLV